MEDEMHRVEVAAREAKARARREADRKARELKEAEERVDRARQLAEEALEAGMRVPEDVKAQLCGDLLGRVVAAERRRKELQRRAAYAMAHVVNGVEEEVIKSKKIKGLKLCISWMKEYMIAQDEVKKRNRRFNKDCTLRELSWSSQALRWKRDASQIPQGEASPKVAAMVSEADTHVAPPPNNSTQALRDKAPPSPRSRQIAVPCLDPLPLERVVGPVMARRQGQGFEGVLLDAGLKRESMGGSGEWAGVGGGRAGEEGVLCPRDVFWKAVVVISHQAGTVLGPWLAAKLGERAVAERPSARGKLGELGEKVEGVDIRAMEDREYKTVADGVVAQLIRCSSSANVPTADRDGGKETVLRSVNVCVQKVVSQGPGHLRRATSNGCQDTESPFTRGGWSHTVGANGLPGLLGTLEAASVIVFAAGVVRADPNEVKWSEVCEDLKCTLSMAQQARAERDAPSTRDNSPLVAKVPVLVTLAVEEWVMHTADQEAALVRARLTRSLMQELDIGSLEAGGHCCRVLLVGLPGVRSGMMTGERAGRISKGALDEQMGEALAGHLTVLTEHAPLQPIVATRSLHEVIMHTVTKATSRIANAAGALYSNWGNKNQPAPSLEESVRATTSAVEQLRGFLTPRTRAAEPTTGWPMREFAMVLEEDISGNRSSSESGTWDGAWPGRGEGGAFVARAALPKAAELGDRGFHPRRRGIHKAWTDVVSGGGLPLDWNSNERAKAAETLLRAAMVDEPSSEIVEALKSAAAGVGQLDVMGAKAVVEGLDQVLGRGVLTIRMRSMLLAELRGVGERRLQGERGLGIDWPRVVRDAVWRNLSQVPGPPGEAHVVHFVVARGGGEGADVLREEEVLSWTWKEPSSSSLALKTVAAASASSKRSRDQMGATRDEVPGKYDHIKGLLAEITEALNKEAQLSKDLEQHSYALIHRWDKKPKTEGGMAGTPFPGRGKDRKCSGAVRGGKVMAGLGLEVGVWGSGKAWLDPQDQNGRGYRLPVPGHTPSNNRGGWGKRRDCVAGAPVNAVEAMLDMVNQEVLLGHRFEEWTQARLRECPIEGSL
ncbi:unnamed protein product [Discosporangium mesarthrocarpum]